MAESSKRLPQSLWIGSSLLFGLLGLTAMVSFLQTRRAETPALPVLGLIADFTLTNQAARVTTLADLTNHVWVADIIFSRCAGPCPRMTQQMKSLQDLLPADNAVRFVTLTTDPGHDTPPVLEKYGRRFDADFSRWMFLTGTKPEIAALASGSLKLSAVPVPAAEQKDAADLFIHTTIFVVVDKHARLRGVFETGGEGVEWTNVQPRLIDVVRQLEHEP